MGNVHSRVLVEITLEKMRECVEVGEFTILQRDSNVDFITAYSITELAQRDILLSLEIEDYCESEPSEKVPGSYVHVFGSRPNLTDSHGTPCSVDMYIKFEIVEKPYGSRTVFISFHEQLFPMTFPFRTLTKENL